MQISENGLSKIQDEIRSRLSEKRFAHTVGVMHAAEELGRILLPERIDELKIAALLHDVTKELDYSDHLMLCSNQGIKVTNEDVRVKEALHSLSGEAMILRDFKCYATEDILKAVKEHTLGSPTMNTFSKIIFISDYVERGRTHKSCIETREYLFSNLKTSNTFEENLQVLNNALLKALDHTVSYVNSKGGYVHPTTLYTINSIKGTK